MYEQIREDHFFIILHAVVTSITVMAGCYLLFRRGNAFAPDISTSMRLRRWTVLFFASLALNQVWYMPVFRKACPCFDAAKEYNL